MPHLQLKSATVDFTIYQKSARSLKKALLRSTVGGLVGKGEDSGRVVVRALQDIDLDLKSGDRLALIGHNGAGKTTLLRVMAGIYHPSGGAIEHNGIRVPLFEIGTGLDQEGTGYENILLRGLLMGFTKSEMEERVKEIAAFSGLGNFLDLPVRTYSSGMMMRLLFSIATSGNCDILLMDEWIATGDQDFIDKANKRLHGMIDRSHIFVFASHNQTMARDLCNKGILLEGGKIVASGSVDDVLEIYAKR